MSIPPIGSNERLSWGAGRVQLTESTAAGTAGAGNPPARAGAGVTDTARNRRNRRLLDTTNTDENAIAAPAINGLSNPAMASGSAATLYAKRPEQVPPDRAQGTAGQPDRVDRGAQVTADQGQVGRLDRHVGAGAHGNSLVGLGQRRGVVDPVTDHRHHPALVLQAPAHRD